ncbi:MAG: DUF885 domain-containing protein, partial [Nitrososphaera sp.]|nr:DUF885 domain-containing protein [Nitrososphaera sp.]
EGLDIKDYLIPFTQFRGIPLTLAQYGSGTVVQPFKTIKDYEDWISRASVFPGWVDSAIVYFRRGMVQNIVLPQQLVVKMIPQMEAFVLSNPTKSVFYGPVNNMPATFADTTKERLTDEYVKLINEQLVPAYTRLVAFLKNDYLHKASTTSVIGALPGGDKMYNHYIRYFTTTNKSADEVYQTGLSEVKRIQKEMEKVKAQVGYKGDLKSYFEYLRTDPKFFPYKTAEEVLNDYRAIQQKVDPALKKMFNHTPKTAFEIRQTEAFRAASAAAQYNAGSPDGSRPGIFYIPIVDPAKTPRARESLFLHEAIPGHHYQVMLQWENESLPAFRRFSGNSAARRSPRRWLPA